MNRLISAVFLCSAAVFLYGEGPDTQQNFSDYLSFISTFPERSEGSEGEQQLIQWITGRFDSSGTDYTIHDFGDARQSHSFSRNIEVDIPGRSADTLMIAVPLNSRTSSPDDSGAGGLATALAAIDYFHGRDIPVSLKFLFLGAEYGSGEAYPLGSKLYLKEYYPDHPVVLLYLSVDGVPSSLKISSGGSRISAPLWLLETCLAILGDLGIDSDYSITETLIARLGMQDNTPVIDPYLQAGYPSLLLSQTGESSDPEGWMRAFVSLLETFSETCEDGFPSTWDRHYLLFQFRRTGLAVGETPYVIGLIVLLCGVLLYPLIFTGRFFRYLKTLGKNALLLPVLPAAVFLFLLLGTFLAQVIPEAKDFPGMWRHAPFLFFALKCTGAVILFMALYRFVKLIPFPRNSSFYSAAAILFLLIDVLVLAFIDLSLSFYVAWAFFFAFLFTILPNRYLKIAAFLLSLSWLFLIMWDIFSLPALRVCNILIYSHVKGNLILGFILLPFLFMLIRIDLLFAHRKSKRRNIITRVFFSILLGTFGYLAVTLLLLDPYTGPAGRPVTVLEFLEQGSHRAEITSPVPLDIMEKRRASLTLPVMPPEQFAAADLSIDTFLDRMNISLRIRSDIRPERLDLRLRSEEKIVIYDASFPYSIDSETGSARFYIGKNPPGELTFELTLPSVLEGNFDLETLYRPPVVRVTAGEEILSVYRTVTVKQTIPLIIDTSQSIE